MCATPWAVTFGASLAFLANQVHCRCTRRHNVGQFLLVLVVQTFVQLIDGMPDVSHANFFGMPPVGQFATFLADRQFLLDKLAAFDSQRQLAGVQRYGVRSHLLVGEQLFVADGACIENIQRDLLPFGQGCQAATFGLVMLGDTLLQVLCQACGLTSQRLQPFALLGQVESICRTLLFQLL